MRSVLYNGQIRSCPVMPLAHRELGLDVSSIPRWAQRRPTEALSFDSSGVYRRVGRYVLRCHFGWATEFKFGSAADAKKFMQILAREAV